jgi:hypothetical protein
VRCCQQLKNRAHCANEAHWTAPPMMGLRSALQRKIDALVWCDQHRLPTDIHIELKGPPRHHERKAA